ncbi:flavodoxin [Brotaphodocola sp.]|uniref:flavodoxin n=1 Tax=Brotaphodocola sp. TaxID=3073577 RepID=UPI003D7C814A
MKKGISVLMTLMMAVSLTACGASGSQAAAAKTSTETAREENAGAAGAEKSENAATAGTINSERAGETSGELKQESNSNVLVAYFSATNTTKGVAENLAQDLHADLFEIVPTEPYTADDLNYNNENSRCSVEMKDASARPAIAASVQNMDQYDVVFLGYPIWWGNAPRIMSTFVESYDFSGKTIVPFCTSASSGIGSSASELEKLTNGAVWIKGQRFSGSDTQSTIVEWVNGLGLE